MKKHSCSVHTIELKREITSEEYWKMREHFSETRKDTGCECYYHNGGYIIEQFKDTFGIIIALKRKRYKNYIIIKSNPKNIDAGINGTGLDYIHICEPSGQLLKTYFEALDKILSENGMGQIFDYKLTRADLCANMKVSGLEKLESYMSLAHMANVPYGFSQGFYPEDKKNGVYFNSKACVIYVYNKLAERIQHMGMDGYPDIEDILYIRFEVRLNRAAIKEMEEFFNIDTLLRLLLQEAEISTRVFNYYLPRFFFTGNYHKLTKAKEIIEKSKHQQSVKADMAELCSTISIRHNFQNVIETFSKSWGHEYVLRLLKYFAELKLNPVCLPQRSLFTYLPSIPSYFEFEGKRRSRYKDVEI